MYFYELHEGDEDVFSDVLLVHDDLLEPEDFFALVQVVRAQVQESYEDDSLIEAIAAELEREHGFTYISDSRLTASVHVSPDDAENRLIDIDDEILGADDLRGEDFLSIVAEFDPDGNRLN